jgi:transcriptional regulator with XRE-family HTH domain
VKNPAMFLHSNIKLLRKRRGRTQDDVAFALEMKRSTYSGYENRVAEPGMLQLLAISKYFGISIDTLVKVDLSLISESQLSQIEKGYDIFVSGGKLRVLATTVDSRNNENIELVAEKAKAGYSSGFSDPEFIKALPVFQLPFLSKERKYRTFQISGDSMLPIPDKSWVTGEFVQDWHSVRDRYPYIILTVDDGIVFKVAENRLKKEKKLILHSLNPLYEPYTMPATEIREIWKFVHYISAVIPSANVPKDNLAETVTRLTKEVQEMKSYIQGKLF